MVHGQKFQNIVFLNGMIGNLVGPYEGRRHNTFMLARSVLLQQPQQHAWFQNRPLNNRSCMSSWYSFTSTVKDWDESSWKGVHCYFTLAKCHHFFCGNLISEAFDMEPMNIFIFKKQHHSLFMYNGDHNILRLFDILPNYSFTINETGRDS